MEKLFGLVRFCQVNRNFRRFYDAKKYEFEKLRNPHVRKIIDDQLKKNQVRGVFNRLVEKRTGEYKDYFSKSSEPSMIKRVQRVSYDHIGQKRALHLSKILREFINERIGSGEIGEILSSKTFQITNIIVPVDLNRIEIVWWSDKDEIESIEELLRRGSEQLKTAIRHAQLLPNLPPVVFRRDLSISEREKINHLIDMADKGTTPNDLDNPSSSIVAERTDLYDTDRTKLLKQLSNQPAVDDQPISIERRAKAFALTKAMRRLEKQRSAIDGLLEIEKEKR